MDPASFFETASTRGRIMMKPSPRTREGQEMDIRTLGIDLAKNLFRVHDVDAKGRTIVARQLRRRQIVAIHGAALTCLVGMEALRRGAPLGAEDRETWT